MEIQLNMVVGTTTKSNNSDYDCSATWAQAVATHCNDSTLHLATGNLEKGVRFIIRNNSGTYEAINGNTGAVSYSDASLATVCQSAATALVAIGGVIVLNELELPTSVTYGSNVVIKQSYQGVTTIYKNQAITEQENQLGKTINQPLILNEGVEGSGIGVLNYSRVTINAADTQTVNGHTGYRIASGYPVSTSDYYVCQRIVAINLYDETQSVNVASGGRFWVQRWGATAGVYIFDTQDWAFITSPTFIIWYIATNTTIPSRTTLCIGDSITFGTGAATPYPTVLQTYSNRTTTNEGVGGYTTGLIKDVWDAEKSASYKHVIVQGGVNDCRLDVAAATAEANLLYIWRDAIALGVTPIATTIMPFKGSGDWTADRQVILDTVNTWIKATAPLYGVKVVDTYTLLEDPGTPDTLLAAYDSGDKIHPSQAGANAIAQAVANAIMY